MNSFKTVIPQKENQPGNCGLSPTPLIHSASSIWILIVQAKLTGPTLVSPENIFSQHPINVRWG